MGGEAAEFSGEVHHDTFAHHEALLEEEVLFHVVFVDDEILEDVPCFFKGGRRGPDVPKKREDVFKDGPGFSCAAWWRSRSFPLKKGSSSSRISVRCRVNIS